MVKITWEPYIQQEVELLPVTRETFWLVQHRLRVRGRDGWKLEMVQAKDALTLTLLFRRHAHWHRYHVMLLESLPDPEDDMFQINQSVDTYNGKGYPLVSLLQEVKIINAEDDNTESTVHVLMFMRQGQRILRELDDDILYRPRLRV